MQNTVQHFQPLFARKFLCQRTHDLEMSERIRDNAGKPRPCRLDILCLNGEREILCFHKTIVAVFKLCAEHLRVAFTDMVKVVALRRDLNAFYKVLAVHAPAHKRKFHADRSVMGVIHIAECFKYGSLVVGLCKLIIHVFKLNAARKCPFVQTTEPVREHLPERERILRRSRFSVALRFFENPPDLTLFGGSEFHLRFCRRFLLWLFEQQPSPPFPSVSAAPMRRKNCLSDKAFPSSS